MRRSGGEHEDLVRRPVTPARSAPARAMVVAIIALLAALIDAGAADAQGGYSLARAKAYAVAQDWAALRDYADGWTRAAPGEPDAWYALGLAYGSKAYRQGLRQPAEAAPAFRRAVTLRPQWPEAWNALALTLQELGKGDEAIDAFTTAIKQAPDRLNYRMSLTAVYSQRRRTELAMRTLGEAERIPRTAQDWFRLGNSYYAVGDGNQHAPAFQRAEAAYRRSLQLDGRAGRVWTNLGTAEEAQGKLDAALRTYQHAGKLGDAEGPRHHARLTAAIAARKAAAQAARSSRTTPPTTKYECDHLSPADQVAWSVTCLQIQRREP